jgi:phosphoribosyl 1,2-cyclic phosphodiesterase
MGFEIKIWGCRGSIPTSSPDQIRFGGATACIEVTAAGQTVIIDAGSGIRELGDRLLSEGTRHAHLLLSHGHYDHIIGLPFFTPVYKSGMALDIWSGNRTSGITTRELISGLLREPYLPITMDFMQAAITFHDVEDGARIELGDELSASCCATNHPGGCLAWRITDGTHSIAYLSDHEHGNEAVDTRLIEFATGADVMIYDAMYTDEEYPSKTGFGHSTWSKACEFAERAKVDDLVLFHHAPERSDNEVEAIEALAHKRFSRATAARDGQIITLG